jgi:hypothetical protein
MLHNRTFVFLQCIDVLRFFFSNFHKFRTLVTGNCSGETETITNQNPSDARGRGRGREEKPGGGGVVKGNIFIIIIIIIAAGKPVSLLLWRTEVLPARPSGKAIPEIR